MRVEKVNPNESLFLNRELSWLEFNHRVLDEALDPKLPLLERLKFLAIFSSNLDEFFMIRVSGLQNQLESTPDSLSPDGLSPATQLRLISERLRLQIRTQTQCLHEEILPQLARKGVRIVPHSSLPEMERSVLKVYFEEQVFPVLTQLSVDPGHPFPYISNISLNLGVRLIPIDDGGKTEPRFARVKLPPSVPRLIPTGQRFTFVLLEDLVSTYIGSLFPAREVLECQPFRITRDADIEIEEDEADDLLRSVERQVRQRKFGFGVRLEVAEGMSSGMVELLRRSLDLVVQDIYSLEGPLNIPDLMALYKLDIPELKDKPFEPNIPLPLREPDSIFDAISLNDILLHHPYDSFGSVVEFIRSAARDPHVLAIKQTLYRAGSNSPIVEALIDAAERGKQVAVLVELKARFDEENNILWARRLEQTGAHVVYGLVGLKTHAKMALVVREEGSTLRRYVHLGTGNYNPATARLYTDFALLTADPDFGADCSEFFNFLTGYSGQNRYRQLIVSPIGMRTRICELIQREIEHHRSGRPAGIWGKMNAITDTELIEELYAASRAGIQIDLLVRGICCLRPGIPGESENIRVGSIVGRFLEHSRVFRFLNGGDEDIYLSGADLMSRNMDRRIEAMFPIKDEEIKARIRREAFELPLSDNVKMRWLSSDGRYIRAEMKNQPAMDSQFSLIS